VAALSCFLFPTSSSFGLILGIDPRGDRVQHIVQNLPLGAEEMIRLPSCSGGWEGPPFGGGQYWFEYTAVSVQEFNEALRMFAAIHRPKLDLVIHDGPRDAGEEATLGGLEWQFTVWHPASWHGLHSKPNAIQLFPRDGYMSPVPPPKVDVYVMETVDWDQVVIPPELTVTDRRASAAPVPVAGGGLIRGVVYDMSTGRPIPWAKVTLTDGDGAVFSATTDHVGQYQIERIAPAGGFDIRFAAEGYATRLCDYRLRQGLQYDEINVELVEAESVQGVAMGAGNTPIPGVEIDTRTTLGIDGEEYECDTAPVLTDAQGRFRIAGLPRGYARLDCKSRRLYKTSPFDVIEVPSEDVQIPFEVTGTIKGKVLGAPPDERVHIRTEALDRKPSWGGSQLCKDDGSFAFEGVPPGRYWVSTVDQRFLEGAEDPTVQIVEVKPGATIELEVMYTTHGEVQRMHREEQRAKEAGEN
jgi:hypothetical protein